MIARDFLTGIVDPGMAFLARALGPNDPPAIATPQVRSMLCSTAGQESGWQYRKQIGGTARGWWQFERAGAVRGVMAHHSSSARVQTVCKQLCIPFDEATVYEAIAWSDLLATAMARLLLWTDAAPLPDVGREADAWQIYLRNWRPGRPRPESWSSRYRDACTAVSETSIAKA